MGRYLHAFAVAPYGFITDEIQLPLGNLYNFRSIRIVCDITDDVKLLL